MTAGDGHTGSGGVGTTVVHAPTAERIVTLRDCMTLLQREPKDTFQLQAKLEKRIVQAERKAQWASQGAAQR